MRVMVYETRSQDESILRRHKCYNCNCTFITKEVLERITNEGTEQTADETTILQPRIRK